MRDLQNLPVFLFHVTMCSVSASTTTNIGQPNECTSPLFYYRVGDLEQKEIQGVLRIHLRQWQITQDPIVL